MSFDLLPPGLSEYVENLSAPEPDYLKWLNRETHASVLMPRMLSGHLQGRVLSMLSYMIRPKTILEIGTYTGYSAICLAEGLAEGGQLHTIDINDELAALVQTAISKAGYQDKITCHLGNALEIIPNLNLIFDLVFIDADKVNYPHYYNLVFDKVKPGGFIISDNVLWSGKVVDSEAALKDKDLRNMLAYNELLRNDIRVENVIFPIRDGLNVVRKIG